MTESALQAAGLFDVPLRASSLDIMFCGKRYTVGLSEGHRFINPMPRLLDGSLVVEVVDSDGKVLERLPLKEISQ